MSAVLSREDNTTAPLHNTTLFAKNDEKKSTIKINPIDRHHCRTSSPPSSFLACLACSLVRTYVRTYVRLPVCVFVFACLLAHSVGRSVGWLAASFGLRWFVGCGCDDCGNGNGCCCCCF